MVLTRGSARKSKRGDPESDAGAGSDDDAPEVVHSTNDEVVRLRELHESSKLPKQKKRKAVKLEGDLARMESAKEEFIDESILEAAAKASQRHKAASDWETDVDTVGKEPSEKTSRKIGKFDVALSESRAEDISMYKTSKSALEFQSTLSSKAPRINFSRYVNQKKNAPAAKF